MSPFTMETFFGMLKNPKMLQLFLFLIFLNNITLFYGYNKNRVINGTIIPQNVFPFAVKIFFDPRNSGHCSGSIISSRHVLTAEHCVPNFQTVKYSTYRKVLGGQHYIDPNFSGTNFADQEYQKFYFANISYIPTLKYKNPWSDTAVIEFPEGTNFGVDAIKLAKDYVEEDGDPAVIVGYGRYRILKDEFIDYFNPLEYSPHKRYGNITIKKDGCFGTPIICGGDSTYAGGSGDSGGVMMINRNNKWYQIGIIASGNLQQCITTRISSYCNFIEEVTKGEAKCESIFPERQGLPTPHFDPIYQGEATPAKLFEFVLPFYVYPDLHGCTATVISKRHLLTSAFCVSNSTSIKTKKFSSYKLITNGKYFADFRVTTFTNISTEEPIELNIYIPIKYRFPDRSKYNLAIIEYPEGTDFGITPITLANDFSQMDREKAILAGYDHYEINDTSHTDGSPPQLKHEYANFRLYSIWDDGYPEPDKWNIWFKYSFLCYDEGGPAIIERNGKWYQIGVSSFIESKYKELRDFQITHHVRLSIYCDFIENVTQNEVKCQSMYDIPVMKEETTVSQTYSLPLNAKTPSSNQETIQHISSSSTQNFIVGFQSVFIGALFINGQLRFKF